MTVMQDNVKIMRELRKALDRNGIKTVVYKIAQSGSIYIKFENTKMGSLRIGDHQERSKYAYRWQIRTDLEEYQLVDEKGHKQFMYPSSKINDLIGHISNYYRKVISEH